MRPLCRSENLIFVLIKFATAECVLYSPIFFNQLDHVSELLAESSTL